jgi:hypothetical protein
MDHLEMMKTGQGTRMTVELFPIYIFHALSLMQPQAEMALRYFLLIKRNHDGGH